MVTFVLYRVLENLFKSSQKLYQSKIHQYTSFLLFLHLSITCAETEKILILAIKLGLEINSSVAIIGFNSPEWFISFFGGVFAGYVLS
jgi:hypothetical protein